MSVESAGPVAPRCVRFESFTLDISRRMLFTNGRRVHLTAKPLDTLIVLLSRPGETISKQELIETVWKDTAVTEDVLVQAIGEIRRALGEKKGEDRFVQTIPRHGYRFVMPVTPVAGDTDLRTNLFQARASGTRWSWVAVVRFAALALLAGALWMVMPRRAPTGASTLSTSGAADSPHAPAARLMDVSTHATIHAAGIVVRIDGDTNRNAEALLEWHGGGEMFRPAHPLVRIDDRHFVGSLFWLAADSSYELKVTLRDPEGVAGPGFELATLRTEPESWPEPTLGVLHVAPTGLDTNTGASFETALRTIQRGAELANPGDVVLIHPGVYRETVHVRKSGTWIQPIVFRGVRPGAIVDGADESIASGTTWTFTETGIYSHEVAFPTTHVATDRGRLFRYASLDDLRALRAGVPGGFFAGPDRLYIKFADSSSPGAHAIHVGRLDHGFVVRNQAWVGIENLEFRYFGGANPGIGVVLDNCSSCRVRRNRIHEVRRAAIWVEGGEHARIEENEIWDTSIYGWPWHAISLSTADNHGIFVAGTNPRGLIIRRNRIHGTFDAIAPCGDTSPPNAVTTETDVYENDLFDLADDGIEAEPYCANLRIWGNRITGVMMGISTAPAAPGPTWILRNVAYRFGAARGREVWLASAFKINTAAQTETGPVFLYHNTFFADVPGVDGIALLEPGKVAFIRARNNVIAGSRHALLATNPLRWQGDGNDLYSTSGDALVHWLGMSYADIGAFRKATGQEQVGLSMAPQLRNPTGGDFTPLAGSPLIDRAVRIDGINNRFTGRAPDVGAIERDEHGGGW